MPIVCTCQNVIACGAVGVGGSSDANCAAHTPTFFRTLTANEKISLRDLVLTVSGTLGGLRNWVAQQYSRRGVSLAAWTDPTITANQTPVRLVHFTEVNTRIDALTLCRCNCNSFNPATVRLEFFAVHDRQRLHCFNPATVRLE